MKNTWRDRIQLWIYQKYLIRQHIEQALRKRQLEIIYQRVAELIYDHYKL